MVRFLKAVNTFDKVTDCIPLVSTVKNVGILLYQLVHKVNKVANPVNTSWIDDIKIHVLSKDSSMAKTASIPVIGNLTALVIYVQNALAKVKGKFYIGGPMGYLAEASRQWNSGCKKHGYEITALYLARNPERSQQSLAKALRFAAGANSSEVFNLILDSRSDWDALTIERTLCLIKRPEDAKLVLDKYKSLLTNENAGMIVSYLAQSFGQDNLEIVRLLLDEFPDIDIDFVGLALQKASKESKTESIVKLLLERFPNIGQKHLDEALRNAADAGLNDRVILLLNAGANVEVALASASGKGHNELFDWLLDTYREKITDDHIGKALHQAIQSFYGKDDGRLMIIPRIIKEYPNLPGKNLEGALERAAEYNIQILKFMLKHFSDIKEENVNLILSKAVLYSQGEEETEFSKNWATVAELIRTKFPGIKASQDHVL